MNDRIISSNIDVLIPRTRSYEEKPEAGNDNNCVAHTIVAILSSYGVTENVSYVSLEISKQYGTDGVPLNQMEYVLDDYFYVTKVPIPPTYSYYYTNQLVGAIQFGGSTTGHCVTIVSINDFMVFYRDDQNGGRVSSCSVTDLRGAYRIDGVR